MQPEQTAAVIDSLLRLWAIWSLEAASKGLIYAGLAALVLRLFVPPAYPRS